MKDTAILLLSLLSMMTGVVRAFAQTEPTKEVLLIGTMHQVPGIIGHSYYPLLKRAKAYQPQAIYVESPPAWDTLSLQNSRAKFLARVDSLKTGELPVAQQLEAIRHKDLSQMKPEDFRTLALQYSLDLDAANAEYYTYLSRYGLKGSPKPTREEDGDLTARLAGHLGIKTLRSMDNQWYRSEYHQAWAACSKADRVDGEIQKLKKIFRSFVLPEAISALTRRYGLYTNSEKTMQKYHTINSFRYREKDCEPCEEGKKYWDLRNLEMARNIGNQIRANEEVRNLVIVGAGHVPGLQEALQREFPDIQVRLLRSKAPTAPDPTPDHSAGPMTARHF